MIAKDHEWAGNPHVQHALVVCFLKMTYAVDPVDVIGALESIMMNMVADASETEDEAREGLRVICADMCEGVGQRYANVQ